MNEVQVLERFNASKRYTRREVNCLGSALFLLGITNYECSYNPDKFSDFEERFIEVGSFEEADLIHAVLERGGHFMVRHPTEGYRVIERTGYQRPVGSEDWWRVLELLERCFEEFNGTEEECRFYRLKDPTS
tara:strand:- start:2056 stop:2451 length:396 start_codon:yes stop_codon:yes gene_type:complete